MKMEYANIDASQQKAWVSSNAVNFVQSQAPCSNKAYKNMMWSRMIDDLHLF